MQLTKSLPNNVHSFDLVAVNELVAACDMTNVPAQGENIDISVFFLFVIGKNV